MDKQIFRKKSLERISSPEQLNDYIRVANPSVWLILIAVLALVVGGLVWSVFGRLDTVVAACAVSEGGAAVCYLREEDAKDAQVGMKVRIGDAECSIAEISDQPVAADASMDSYILHVGGFEEGEWLYQARLEGEVEEGVHAAQLVVESVSPMHFMAN